MRLENILETDKVISRSKFFLEKVKNYRSKNKIVLDEYLDPSIFLVSANGALIYGADKVLDILSASKTNHEGLAMFGAYLGLTTTLVLANKYLVRPISKRIYNRHKDRLKNDKQVTALSWVKSFGLIGAMAILFSISNYKDTLSSFYYDGSVRN